MHPFCTGKAARGFQPKMPPEFSLLMRRPGRKNRELLKQHLWERPSSSLSFDSVELLFLHSVSTSQKRSRRRSASGQKSKIKSEENPMNKFTLLQTRTYCQFRQASVGKFFSFSINKFTLLKTIFLTFDF